MKTGTNTIQFRPKSAIPKHKKVTYGRIVSSLRPHKEEQHRTRLTVGGNLLDYEGDANTPTSDRITTKLHLNSVISTKKQNLPQQISKTSILTTFYLKVSG